MVYGGGINLAGRVNVVCPVGLYMCKGMLYSSGKVQIIESCSFQDLLKI